MPLPVIDVSSNLPENLERWANSLRGGGTKLQVFQVVYSGKKRHWTVKEIAAATKGKLSGKNVAGAGKKLVGDALLNQLPNKFPIVYEKRPDVHHHKTRILRLAQSKTKRNALPTKRKIQVSVRTHNLKSSFHGRARQITIDDIDQFQKAARLSRKQRRLSPISESRFKKALQKIFKQSGTFNDWGGERDDFFTNKLKVKGKRHSAAFALKGPGVGTKTMTPGKWGKHGNQIQRLVQAPAQVFLLQFEGIIDEYSIEQLQKLTEHRAHQEKARLFYGYIDRDDSLRLRHAFPKEFRP